MDQVRTVCSFMNEGIKRSSSEPVSNLTRQVDLTLRCFRLSHVSNLGGIVHVTIAEDANVAKRKLYRS